MLSFGAESSAEVPENISRNDFSTNRNSIKTGSVVSLSGESEVPKKKNYLTCFYTNANSLKNKRSEFEGKIDRLKPDVVGIN